jgi:hypothetical protein
MPPPEKAGAFFHGSRTKPSPLPEKAAVPQAVRRSLDGAAHALPLVRTDGKAPVSTDTGAF